MWQRVLGLLVATGVGLAAATDAKATPFGPGTGSIAFTFSPTVTLGGSGNAAHANGTAIIFSTTSNLIGLTTGLGTVDGTLNFSTTVGTTVTESISNFLRFNDTTGGTFDFSAASVTTQSFTNNPGVSTSLALFVLGSMGDSHLGLTATPTSVTMTLNSTGGSAYSASATLSNPPSTPPVPPISSPEPVSLAILGNALLALGLVRRRR